jgi:threonylcarbamoyladenosine tRNA methylthiotransferase MtaB
MQHIPAVAIINHGCKLNQFEGEALACSFREAGFRVVDSRHGESPDITIVNTCTVTSNGDRKSRQSIYRAVASKDKNGIVVVTGCYAETDGIMLGKISGVDLVVGNKKKAKIMDIIRAYRGNGMCSVPEADTSFQYRAPEHPDRSRVYVKVQDGCSMRCAYCKVPRARGSSRSRNLQDILTYVKKLVENGYKEIVLTGINLGDYNDGSITLSGLLSPLLELDPSYRIRLSSIEPFLFEKNLIKTVSHPRIVPHFHIPLQSGSDRILRLMNRPYSAREYVGLVKTLKILRPDAHFATDVIVGFPTETADDFYDTMRVVNEVEFASMHVFRYSPRDGTKAARLEDTVSPREKGMRSKTLIQHASSLNFGYRMRFLHTVRDAVFERHTKDRPWVGITDNYIKAELVEHGKSSVHAYENLSRRLLPVRVVDVQPTVTLCEIAR